MQNTITCKNCNNQFIGNFCNECGQKSDTQKLKVQNILTDLQNGLFAFHNGIIYTIKQLLTRPGHSIREYIEGKRVQHFKPFSFVIVCATAYGLLFHFLVPDSFHIESSADSENILSGYLKVINWSLDHFAYASLIIILSTTSASYIVFKKQSYNLAEHLVLNTYFRGLVLLISILIFTILYLYHGNNTDGFNSYLPFFQLLDFGLMYWCYSQFFNKLSKIKSLGLTILSFLLFASINMLIAFIAGLIANSIS